MERVTKKATGSSEGGMVHETVERSVWIVCIVFYNAAMLYTPYLYWTQFGKKKKFAEKSLSQQFAGSFLLTVFRECTS